MREINEKIKVIAVFEPGQLPRPYKFKIKDNIGNEQTIYVDEIESIYKWSDAFLVYSCKSYFENNTSRTYELKYYKKECQWELVKVK